MIVGVVVAQAGGPATSTLPPSASPSASAPVATQPEGFLATATELKDRVALGRQGTEPYASALADLLTWGQTAVGTAPAPVSPLVVVGTENILVDDATRAYGLGLAYVATGDEAYATAARRTIRAWVDAVKSTADTCTDNGGCNTSLILGRVAPGFIFGADLIRTSASWSAADTKALQDWLRTVILPAASERPNNWGDAGTFLRIAAAEYIGDDAEFDAAVTKWRSLLDLVEPDGRIPEESRRGRDGISYTQEALQYKVAVAQLAERRGINLWDAVGSQGGSLKVAFDRLAFYVRHPAQWPDATNPEVPDPGPAWEIAYAHWHDPAWVEFVQAARPYGDAGHSALRWTTLTNGVPIDESAGAGSPSASSGTSSALTPSTAPSPSPSISAAAQGLANLQVGLVSTAAPGDVRLRVAWSAPESGTVAIDSSTTGGWNPLLQSSRSTGTAIFSRAEGGFAVRGRVL
ncbi:MAG TPA: alginate lyase family protein, partial [Candidatus Limnocylindrales bacterium]|nr:alginate lyase family protein [Candidatus Limnocylindrales bacterium]